jgi:hypothetical protein
VSDELVVEGADRSSRGGSGSDKPAIVAVAIVVLVASLLGFGAFRLNTGGGDRLPPFVPEPGPGAYTGLGTWVDLFETAAWANPEAAVAKMASHGVKTVYVESSNYSHEAGVVFPDQMARMIDAAHAAGISVVAWYLPGLENIDQDLQKSLAAIGFTTAEGEGFDGFAMDIEAMLIHDPTQRTNALLRLSRKIRAEVGPNYPLGAITPNPMRLMGERNYWPDFPYPELSILYDVIMPMDYFGAVAEASNKAGAFKYSIQGLREIRAGAVTPGVPIHVIGGLAADITGPELEGFLKAVDKGKAIGYSVYNFTTTGEADWAGLQSAVAAGLTNGVGATP